MAEKETKNNEGAEDSEKKIFPEIPDDFYERLGVSRDASEEEINIAWKRKVKNFHPDKNRGQEHEAQEWTKALNEARQTLGDSKKRERYNKEHPNVSADVKEEEGADKETKERETSEARAAVVETYDAHDRQDAGDTTIYDLSSAKKDKVGWFVFIDGYKVYINDKLPEKDKVGNLNGPPLGAPVNPFWRKQADLLSPSQRFFEKAPTKMEGGREKIRNFTRSLLGLNENPREERRSLEEYENMVRNGEAEFVRELAAVKAAPINHAQKNIPDARLYKIMRKAYDRKGSFDDYEFKLIGVYDEKGRFTGKTRLYRIKK